MESDIGDSFTQQQAGAEEKLSGGVSEYHFVYTSRDARVRN
jgi:hypothetical protein